jgi:hypothetical protein
MTCDEVAAMLSTAPDGQLSLGGAARRHVDGCLRCQAEAVHYRRLRRELRSLRTQSLPAPQGLLGEVLDALPVGGPRPRGARRRAAYVGGLAAATAAGVGGVIVLASRTRRRLPLAG